MASQGSPPPAAAHPVPPAADALARTASAPAAPPSGPFTLLDVRNSPVPLKLTWARDAVYPAAICLRKDLRVLSLVKFTAKADLTLPDTRLICGFSAKARRGRCSSCLSSRRPLACLLACLLASLPACLHDTIFHGRFSLNVPARMVEYRKKFQLPNGTGLAVSAGLQHIGGDWDLSSRSLRSQFKPLVAAQFNFGSSSGGNVVFAGDGFNVKQRVPIPRRWVGIPYPRFELETYATIKVPQLTTRYSLQRDGMRSGFPDSIGEEQDPLHLHVAAANFVIRL
ncbi:expressed protein [Chlorella variabilis]|uniref:Expressed protein n=1 Tax=Chlorella variabilis TaxID=554065 RepID=E1ZKY6_CHLVA|nr:expressed protein [Chlorella variabilis]EFN53463.1 expressed protein [Chlorella variabilis]|eukprot:XP_005845565.1 expressed protein [Chlorella variabilis]